MAKTGRGGRRGGDGGGKRKFPPSRRNHRITHAVARRMRRRYLAKYANTAGALEPGAYDRKIFDRILADERTVGLRLYPGVDERGRTTVLFCGVDARGDDILIGIIGDNPFRCPPFCSVANGVLQF